MTKPSTTIIYVPGLGDVYDRGRAFALKSWSRRHLDIVFVPMKWRSTSESYADKMRKVEVAIERCKSDRIVLVGESAGGAIVTAAGFRFKHKVDKTITIFGKNAKAHSVSPYLYRRNLAFKDAMMQSDYSIEEMNDTQAKKYLVIYSPFDPTIRKIDTYIPGAKMRKISTPGHLLSIALVLTVFQSIVIREASR